MINMKTGMLEFGLGIGLPVVLIVGSLLVHVPFYGFLFFAIVFMILCPLAIIDGVTILREPKR